MSTLSIEQLKKKATELRDEVEDGSITAKRIGSLFLAIIEKLEEMEKRIRDLEK
jgi:hypothetical protein